MLFFPLPSSFLPLTSSPLHASAQQVAGSLPQLAEVVRNLATRHQQIVADAADKSAASEANAALKKLEVKHQLDKYIATAPQVRMC